MIFISHLSDFNILKNYLHPVQKKTLYYGMDLSIPELIYNRHNLMHLFYACILCRRIKLVYILFYESIHLCYACILCSLIQTCIYFVLWVYGLCQTRIRHLKPSKHVKKLFFQVKCNFRLKEKITKFTVLKKKSVPFSFFAVNFRKPLFVNGILSSPYPGVWTFALWISGSSINPKI